MAITKYRFLTEETEKSEVVSRITGLESDHYRIRLDALVARDENSASVVRDRAESTEAQLKALYSELDLLEDNESKTETPTVDKK